MTITVCSDCSTPLQRAVHGNDCGYHAESELLQRSAYIIDLEHPQIFTDWEDGRATIVLEPLLPDPQPTWFTIALCCAWWREPDWEDDWCPKCEDFMVPVEAASLSMSEPSPIPSPDTSHT